MLDLLALAAAILAVSLLGLVCCGAPTSSKLSFNQTSQEGGMATGLENSSRPRKLATIECENFYQEKTLEDEEKKKRRRKGAETVSSLTVGGQVRAKKKSNQAEERPKPLKKRKSIDDKDKKPLKKGEGGRKRKSLSADPDKNSLGRASTAIDSDRPTIDSKGRVPRDEKRKKKKGGEEKRDKDNNDDESNKDGGGSKRSADDSRKTAGTPKQQQGSTERMGTNETIASRDRIDEVDSAKQKREAAPALSLVMASAETQGESEKPKKGSNETTPPQPPTKSPMVKPKRKLSRKKEEEVRAWNEAIASGNVFRPRKDDETIDEVNCDWNG